MAKKEKIRAFLQLPLPEDTKAYRMVKRSWSGMNLRETIDTGMLSFEKDISTKEAPYLTPADSMTVRKSGYYSEDGKRKPLGLFGFEDFLILIYYNADLSAIMIDYIKAQGLVTYTGILKKDPTEKDLEANRCVVQFNAYNSVLDVAEGFYQKQLLIFPDKVSIPMHFYSTNTSPMETVADGEELKPGMYKFGGEYYKVYYDPQDGALTATDGNNEKEGNSSYFLPDMLEAFDEEGNVLAGFPPIKYATVHLSRLFGVSDDKVYASGFNDYANWNLDDIDTYNESNAWCSAAQSNTRADSDFKGITVYQNHVICFKDDFMHEIYNTKNPFRIQDIFSEGTIDARSIQDVDGRLIFVSADDVKIYTGSNPRGIGYNLNMTRFDKAVSGSDGRFYYLYCEKSTNDTDNPERRFFVYDTLLNEWSQRSVSTGIINFAFCTKGLYALGEDGCVYDVNSGKASRNWAFETDLITNKTVDIKHIKKLQLLADIDEGAFFKVYFLYDDEEFNESSHLVYVSTGREGKTTVRVKPRMTAGYGFKVRVEGSGYVKLYEMELAIQDGGELYV